MSWPNMALTNMELKDPNGVSFFRGENRRERGREEKERRRKKKKRKSKQSQAPKKGMELLTLSRDPWFCLVNGYLWYPNLGFVRISS